MDVAKRLECVASRRCLLNVAHTNRKRRDAAHSKRVARSVAAVGLPIHRFGCGSAALCLCGLFCFSYGCFFFLHRLCMKPAFTRRDTRAHRDSLATRVLVIMVKAL